MRSASEFAAHRSPVSSFLRALRASAADLLHKLWLWFLARPRLSFYSPLFSTVFFALAPSAHVVSPDVFYDGMVGPYPARITVRMPPVVPGRAEISVRVRTDEPVKVSFRPLYTWTPATNAPPPDPGLPVAGE